MRYSLFSCQSYNGGNKLPSDQVTVAQQLQEIRQSIFQSESGTIDSKHAAQVQLDSPYTLD